MMILYERSAHGIRLHGIRLHGTSSHGIRVDKRLIRLLVLATLVLGFIGYGKSIFTL
jgi:hypothetical protein